MTHLDLDRLLALREPGTEPGDAAARQHLAECAVCRDELARLDQRVARLRALPALRPSRDAWPAVQARVDRERAARQRRRAAWGALGGLALAAGVAGVMVLGPAEPPAPARGAGTVAVGDELEAVKARSQALEAALQQFGPEGRVVDARTEGLAVELESRIAELDRRLDVTELSDDAARDAALLRLWQERVGLLDALVDVRLTRASHVGL
jgi:anti-sigma factor RsiW